jgi:hypothetical protein
MAQAVWVEVSTPVGLFAGFASGQIPDGDAALEAEITNIQGILYGEKNDRGQIVSECRQFTIFDIDNNQITLQGEVLKNSVFKFLGKAV